MSDLNEYKAGLYAVDESPDRIKSIELLLIRIVDALDLVMMKLDQDQAAYSKEGRALQNIAKALNKIAKAHEEMTEIQQTIYEERENGNDT